MPRLPIPGSDDGTWGDILNDYLKAGHNNDGTHKTIPITQGGTGATSASSARTALSVPSTSDLTDHTSATTSVHGIADTSTLETTTGAQAKVDTHVNETAGAHAASAIAFTPTGSIAASDVQAAIAEVASEAANPQSLADHEADTTNIHGIADTSLLETTSGSQAKVNTHAALTATHGVTGSIVGTTDTQTLTNKTLSDSTTTVVDATDATKAVKFDVAGTTGVTGTIATAFTTAKTLTLPDATDTLVGRNTTDTLTNKTLTSPVINTPTGITKTDVGLSNVDNTSDANKPVSTATQTALNAKLNLAGGTMTGGLTFNGQRAIGPQIGPYTERYENKGSVSGTVTLDFGQYNMWRINPSADVTISFTNLPASGVAAAGTLIIANSLYNVTYPAGTKYPGGTAPTLNGETWLSVVAIGSTVTIGKSWGAVQ